MGGKSAAAIFGSEPLRAPAAVSPNAPGRAWIEERTRVAVSRNINVSGRLIFQEPVRIEGRFRGEISSSELVVISEGAQVEGKTRTPRLLVLGELLGEVLGSKSVVLGPRAKVTATVETENLTVCEGARLDGDVRVIRPQTPAAGTEIDAEIAE
ncbi:MAG: bactofilin family protein [Bryobacteraceae bacterium]